MKNFLASKKVGWYVSVVALVLALITLIAYVARGGNYLSPVESSVVIVLIVGIVLNAVVLWKDFKVGAILPLVFYAISTAILLNTEMLFVSNVAFGVDGNSFDLAFYVFIVCDVLSVIVSAVAFSMGLSKQD